MLAALGAGKKGLDAAPAAPAASSPAPQQDAVAPRKLPIEDVCSILGADTGAKPTEYHSVATRVFGDEASVKSRGFLSSLGNLASSAINAAAGGIVAAAASAVGSVVGGLLGGGGGKPSADGAKPAASGGPPSANPTVGQGADRAVLITGELGAASCQDSCHSAIARAVWHPPPPAGVVHTRAGCQSNETSADVTPGNDPSAACGALSNAICTVIRKHHKQDPTRPITNRHVPVASQLGVSLLHLALNELTL